MMVYVSPNATHAVFQAQAWVGERRYPSEGFDIVKLVPGVFVNGKYAEGSFIGHRMTIDEATAWADRCEQPERMVPHHFSAERHSHDSIRLDGWNEDGSGEGPEISLTQASALNLVRVVVTALDS